MMTRFCLVLYLIFSVVCELAIGEEIQLTNPIVYGKASSISGGNGELVTVTIAGGSKETAGVTFKPSGADSWDFSAHSRIEAVVTNTGALPLPLSLRVDNKGHWKTAPWNTEMVRLNPGDTKTIVVFFGRSFGWKPSFSLDKSAVVQLLLFTSGTAKERSFAIESLSVLGPPNETPEQWQANASGGPAAGRLYHFKSGLKSSRQLSARGGAKVENSSSGIKLAFASENSTAMYRPARGRWDLRASNHVEVEITNESKAAIQPLARVDSTKGSTDYIMVKEPIPPGATARLAIAFAPRAIWTLAGDPKQNKPAGGTAFVSKSASSISFMPGKSNGPVAFRITQIAATSPPVTLAPWVGLRPPVEGDWEMTFNEEFTGPELNKDVWNIYTENYWDKKAHFSKDNVSISDGKAILRFEKKKGHHNDDPSEKTTDYATGFLDTFGKWTQRYGYFECRMKLPKEPGLWPAFWMMPDRGPANAPRWKREDTSNGGMEFDIMEFLSGWGPYRYNIAFHWDGYGKRHRHTGTSELYFQHDLQGYITSGMLWIPEGVVYYCNGKPIARWRTDRVSNVPSQLRFTQVSGGWDNTPLDDAKLPSDFVIDYVRVWQRKDLKTK